MNFLVRQEGFQLIVWNYTQQIKSGGVIMNNDEVQSIFDAYKENKEKLNKIWQQKYYIELGNKIRLAREEAGLTLAELGSKLLLTSAAISNYESGIRHVPVHILTEIASILNKPIGYLLGPSVSSSIQISDALIKTVEKFTDATYIKDFFVIKNNIMQKQEEPHPMIPLPPDITKEHHFALSVFCKDTETCNFYLCKWFNPDIGSVKLAEDITSTLKQINNDNPVIITKESSLSYHLATYKDVKHADSFKDGTFEDYHIKTTNLIAIVISRVERLVK